MHHRPEESERAMTPNAPAHPTDRTEPWAGHDAGMPAPPSTSTPAPAPAPRGSAKPRTGRGSVAILIPILAALIVVGTLLTLESGTQTASSPTGSSTGPGTAAISTIGSVVDINTSTQALGADGLQPLGAGSGMILTAGGEILTNNHVVEGASSIRVSIAGQGSETASVVGVDPTDDVALLQLDNASGLSPITTGDSSAVQPGDSVTVIGNAFGQGGTPTVSTGSVTAVHRSITASDPGGANSERLTDVIQINAGVHPGDSGGALVNANGQVIGIITAGPSNSSTGIGFAIPIDSALGIVNQIRAGDASSTILLGERGFMGIAVGPMDPTISARLGVSDIAGALVAGVQPGGPAAAAGMTAPAVIRSIDGRAVTSVEELGTAIHAKTPGQQIQVSWVDRSGTHTASVTLTSGPAV
jgi:S1-C subfamily serine protease